MAVGAGSWNGKVFPITPGSIDVVNLLSPIPTIGNIWSVYSYNWTQQPPLVVERYPGKIGTSMSWFDFYKKGGTFNPSNRVWTLTYDDVTIPSNTTANDIFVAYARLVKGSIDEVRLIEPGYMLGNLFRRPNSYMNPTPLPIDNGIRFALIQVCDGNGNYARTGNSRKL